MHKQWYAVRTHVGYERRVKAVLQKKVHEHGQESLFGEIVVPTEKVIDLVRGKKQTVERCLFPDYVFVEMACTQAARHVVHAIPKIVGFVGEADTAPTPIPTEKIREILQQVEAGMAAPRSRQLFIVGERVKIVEGPLRDFTGTVESVKPERARVRVAVGVFGRPTPMELDFLQVEAA